MVIIMNIYENFNRLISALKEVITTKVYVEYNNHTFSVVDSKEAKHTSVEVKELANVIESVVADKMATKNESDLDNIESFRTLLSGLKTLQGSLANKIFLRLFSFEFRAARSQIDQAIDKISRRLEELEKADRLDRSEGDIKLNDTPLPKGLKKNYKYPKGTEIPKSAPSQKLKPKNEATDLELEEIKARKSQIDEEREKGQITASKRDDNKKQAILRYEYRHQWDSEKEPPTVEGISDKPKKILKERPKKLDNS